MWIDKGNFDMLLSKDKSGGVFPTLEEELVIELIVDYNSLDGKQKKLLPTLTSDFKVAVSEKSRPPKTLKHRLVKYRNFEKKDIIPLIKDIMHEKDRDKVLADLIEYDISPIVISLWLARIFSQTCDSFKILLEAETYIYSKVTYYVLISSYRPTSERLKFSFPKKLR